MRKSNCGPRKRIHDGGLTIHEKRSRPVARIRVSSGKRLSSFQGHSKVHVRLLRKTEKKRPFDFLFFLFFLKKKSDFFLLTAVLISFLVSVGLWFSGYKDEGLYVGIWVPSILALGSYLKQIK